MQYASNDCVNAVQTDVSDMQRAAEYQHAKQTPCRIFTALAQFLKGVALVVWLDLS